MKKKPGRPPKEGEARSHKLIIRITPKEAVAYKAAADEANTSVSEWVRKTMNSLLPPKKRKRPSTP
jgi:predicted HicB family RNase H-like nuclease